MTKHGFNTETAKIFVGIVLAGCAGFWTIFEYDKDYRERKNEVIEQLAGHIAAMNLHCSKKWGDLLNLAQESDKTPAKTKCIEAFERVLTYQSITAAALSDLGLLNDTKQQDHWKSLLRGIDTAWTHQFKKQSINEPWCNLLKGVYGNELAVSSYCRKYTSPENDR